MNAAHIHLTHTDVKSNENRGDRVKTFFIFDFFPHIYREKTEWERKCNV